MENINHQNIMGCCHDKKGLFSALSVVLIIFLIIISVSVVAGVFIKIKQLNEPAVTRTISFTGNGEIYAKPDLAIVNFSVVTEKKTVVEAITENTNKMNKVIESAKKQGVDAKDLKTIGFNIYSRYDYISKSDIYSSGTRVFIGYEIRQSLQVKIRNLENVGAIIEAATSAGANEVGDLQFTIDKEEELKSQARAQAIEQAKSKAKELASQLGIKLVRISSFFENGYSPVFYESSKGVPLGIGGGGDAPAPQIETGQNKISISVTITYDIK